jgi:hypothetical protein
MAKKDQKTTKIDQKAQKSKQKIDPKLVKQLAQTAILPEHEAKSKGYYFDNYKVEQLLTVYVKGGCVDVKLRDEIMLNAMELLRQIIRTHNFHNIYPGHDPASFGDLFQTGWCQIEKTLYKFNYEPGHTKVFNLWSQVAKTVILAYIKREMRDKKNYGSYKNHQINHYKPNSAVLERFINEARSMGQYDEDGLRIVDCLEKLYKIDEKPYDGLIGKLVRLSGLSRQRIVSFLKQVRLRSFEFTDSPLNQERSQLSKGGSSRDEDGEEDYN